MFFREVVMNISCVFSWDLTFPSERGRALPIFCGNLTHLTIREAFEKTGCAKFDPVGKLSLFFDIFDGGGIVGFHPPNKFIFAKICLLLSAFFIKIACIKPSVYKENDLAVDFLEGCSEAKH